MNINLPNELVGSIVATYVSLFAPPPTDVAYASTLSAILHPSPIPKSPAMSKNPSLGSSLDSLGDSRGIVKESAEVYQTGFYLFWIANYTGESIEYYVEEGKYAEWNSAKASVVHTVENGQKLPLRLSRTLFKV
jgi:hypothetical protein